jgi:hypothetical protein
VRITAGAARRILRGQRMPSREIRAVMTADDPLLVRRLFELHRERLEEWLEEQRSLAARIERSLVDERQVPASKAASRDRTRSITGTIPFSS